MSDRTRLDIRQYRPGDGDRIRAVNEAAIAATPELPDRDLDAIEREYLDGDGDFLVGCLGDRIVATGAYTTPDQWKDMYVDLDEQTAELTRMRVAPDHQGQGFGTALYEAHERRARSDGYDRFVLDTGTANEQARQFYQTLGFECLEETSLTYDGHTMSLALYQRCLEM